MFPKTWDEHDDCKIESQLSRLKKKRLIESFDLDQDRPVDAYPRVHADNTFKEGREKVSLLIMLPMETTLQLVQALSRGLHKLHIIEEWREKAWFADLRPFANKVAWRASMDRPEIAAEVVQTDTEAHTATPRTI